MHFKDVEWDGVNWINPDEDSDKLRAIVNMVMMNLRLP
jgi:hypothetical protein